MEGENESIIEALVNYYGYCTNRANRKISTIKPGLAFSKVTKDRVNKALAEREHWKGKMNQVQQLILKLTGKTE